MLLKQVLRQQLQPTYRWMEQFRMNLVFIHGNFPGQFKDIAPALAQRSGGRTIFLTFLRTGRASNCQELKRDWLSRIVMQILRFINICERRKLPF